MKKPTYVLLSLLLTASAFAARFEVPQGRALEPVRSERKAEVLRSALKAFTLDDESVWITHFVPAVRDPSAIGVTRFAADGSARLFLLSDWLPKKQIPRGSAGQVYGITLLTDGRLAASGGWNDGRNSHNAVIVLRPEKDGTYTTERVIELPVVGEIAGGPNNSIIAVTADPAQRGGGPLLAVIDRNGAIIGRLLGAHESLSPMEGAQNASRAHVRRVGDNRIAIYDPHIETIIVFDLTVGTGEAVAGGRFSRFIGDDAGLHGTRLLGFDVTADKDVLVIRSGRVRGRPGTDVTIYDRDGGIKQTTTLDAPWNLVLRERNQLRGVVLRGEPHLDTVRLDTSK